MGYETLTPRIIPKEISCLLNLSYEIFLELPLFFHIKIFEHHIMSYEMLY